MTPRELYGRFALAEAVTWTLLILGMVLKYTGVSESFVPVFGMLHGVVFLGYCVVTCFVWVDQRWSAGFGALGLASAVVPWATIPFERRAERTGRLAGGGRGRPRVRRDLARLGHRGGDDRHRGVRRLRTRPG